jgi:hypothetical protein
LQNAKEREMTRDNPDPEWGDSGRLKEILDSAALDEPSRGALARLRGRLAAAGIGIAAVSAGKTVVGLGVAVKITVGIAVAAGISAGTLYLADNADAPRAVSPTDVHYRGTPLVEPKPLVSKDDAAPPDTQSSPERQSAPESASPEEPAPVPRRNAASSRAARQTLSVEASVKAEAELLHRARSALKKNPEEALSLTEEHETSYPAGVLAEERDFIAINALKRMGREEEACERAARFIAAHPKAAQASELAEMCERADTSAKRAPISGKP